MYYDIHAIVGNHRGGDAEVMYHDSSCWWSNLVSVSKEDSGSPSRVNCPDFR